jgi:hypothetical protein
MYHTSVVPAAAGFLLVADGGDLVKWRCRRYQQMISELVWPSELEVEHVLSWCHSFRNNKQTVWVFHCQDGFLMFQISAVENQRALLWESTCNQIMGVVPNM